MCLYNKIIKNPIGASLSNHSDNYPTPINLSYFWGFGSLAGIALAIQLFTGIFLAMHYVSDITLAFISIEHVVRDVFGGAGLRYLHANGASMFFIVIYCHMFRVIYYGSYSIPYTVLWYTGVLLFLLVMATAFMGYVLPWGQMSFWGATVITNLFSAIPFIGKYIVLTLWGGFSVDNPTLNRFFSLHYLLPFLITGLVIGHLLLLHINGSNNPLGIESIVDRVSFLPYFYIKDFFGIMIFALIFSFFIIYAPNYLGHPDNYIEANPMVTPPHIVPEWYFLPFYAILRTVPYKLGGVLLMLVAIIVLLFLVNLDISDIRSTFFKPFHVNMFWLFFWNCIMLGWVGQEVVESPFVEFSRLSATFYFVYFIIILPIMSALEKELVIEYNKFK